VIRTASACPFSVEQDDNGAEVDGGEKVFGELS
jgi:hypothetical protein